MGAEEVLVFRLVVIMPLPANLVISIEGMQPDAEGYGGGGGRSQGPVFGATASVLLPGGTSGTPGQKQQQQLTSGRGPCTLIVSHTHMDRVTHTHTHQVPKCCLLHLGLFMRKRQFTKKNPLQWWGGGGLC